MLTGSLGVPSLHFTLGIFYMPLCDGMQAELRQPRFEEGLHDVLDLADSLSLTDILQAADLDITAEGEGVSKAEAGLQAAQSLVVDSTDSV